MRRPEQDLQQQAIAFIRRAYPTLVHFHVPNSSGNRGRRLGGIMKSMGLLAGVPDIVVVQPNGLAGFLELKAGRGKLTESQAAFRDRVTKLGCCWAEIRTIEQLATTLESWLLPFGWVAKARIAA